MAIKFCQIVDSLFDKGTEDQLRDTLNHRMLDIAFALAEIPHLIDVYSMPRRLKFEDGTVQWRSDYWILKESRRLSWDKVFEVVNKIKAVPYDTVSDDKAWEQIAALSGVN